MSCCSLNLSGVRVQSACWWQRNPPLVLAASIHYDYMILSSSPQKVSGVSALYLPSVAPSILLTAAELLYLKSNAAIRLPPMVISKPDFPVVMSTSVLDKPVNGQLPLRCSVPHLPDVFELRTTTGGFSLARGFQWNNMLPDASKKLAVPLFVTLKTLALAATRARTRRAW